MLVYDREISVETPAYFVALDFDGDRVVSIHDFLFARYAMDGVELSPLNPVPQSLARYYVRADE
jgi:RNA polymerase sigma-70 factor, ECF subfamily